jgi:predicted outer membrane repeat protein
MNEVLPSDILKPSLVLFTKCCTFCFFILSIFISSSVVFAATIFVPGDYDTIQDAINASSTGDTVSVADGTYNGNILFPGNKTNITLISENGPESTVIYGDHNGSVVTFAAGINSTLDGFTITNGSTSENGGGVLIGSSSSPTIANCIITDNEAFAGGGISCGDSSTPFITNSIIQNNSVTGDNDLSNGGGIHASSAASPTITNCIIKNNTSERNGGGMAFNSADEPWIVNCIFSNNTAAVNGGAISFANSAPIITNCTFSNNSASSNGGAIACTNPLSGTAVANSILWGNSPDEISCDSEISVTYSDIQGETTWLGTGNINADPMFMDEENGDIHLLNDSPCIDAGDNSALALPATDIDGDDRKIDDPAVADTGYGTPPIVDMGADELNCDVEDCINIIDDEPPTSGGGGDQSKCVYGEDSDGDCSLHGIFGDIFKSSVIGYHLDGWTAEGIEIYMPVTQGFKALKGAQEYVRSFAPALAEFVRECFDYLEQKADANKEGSLYNFGTHVFPVLGKIAEGCLRLLGQEDYMNDAYVSTTIGVEEFKKLKSEGRAIAPKIVKEVVNLEQEEGLSSLVY